MESVQYAMLLAWGLVVLSPVWVLVFGISAGTIQFWVLSLVSFAFLYYVQTRGRDWFGLLCLALELIQLIALYVLHTQLERNGKAANRKFVERDIFVAILLQYFVNLLLTLHLWNRNTVIPKLLDLQIQPGTLFYEYTVVLQVAVVTMSLISLVWTLQWMRRACRLPTGDDDSPAANSATRTPRRNGRRWYNLLRHFCANGFLCRHS